MYKYVVLAASNQNFNEWEIFWQGDSWSQAHYQQGIASTKPEYFEVKILELT